jgi:hypothetical protein
MIAWCPCTDSNRDRAPFESAASTDWATRTLSRHCLSNGIAMFGAPRRIRTANARSLSPSPRPVGLVERNGATGADRTRGLVLTENALFRLSYGGDGAREGGRLPGLRVTRALSYAGTTGAGGEDRTSDPGLTKTLHFRRATPARKIHKRPGPTRPKRSLPETTVCRPTKGDQYRISGPSYVLAGTAILNSETLHVITRPRFSAG